MNMSMREIDEKYLDVMQNIEAVIISAYRDDQSMSDYSIMSVLEALINAYTAEITRRIPRSIKLSPQEQTLFESLREICEWRLGRGNLKDNLEQSGVDVGKKTIEEILIILKRLLKSAKFWNREEGSQGYLKYINRFL
jgi:hypothetical protein